MPNIGATLNQKNLLELIDATAVNMALAQRRADTANLNILSLFFFIFRLTVLQLKFYFKCHFRLLNYISTGRTQQQIPLLRQCPSLAAIFIYAEVYLLDFISFLT